METVAMTPKRRNELTWGKDPQHLTDEEIANGYHWCPEWDDLMVGPEDSEWGGQKRCYCGHEVPETD